MPLWKSISFILSWCFDVMWICGYRILDTSPWGLAQLVQGWGGFVFFLFVHRDEWLLFQSLNFRLSYHLELLYISQSWFFLSMKILKILATQWRKEISSCHMLIWNFIFSIFLTMRTTLPQNQHPSLPCSYLLPSPQNAFCKNCFRERFLGIHLI